MLEKGELDASALPFCFFCGELNNGFCGATVPSKARLRAATETEEAGGPSRVGLWRLAIVVELAARLSCVPCKLTSWLLLVNTESSRLRLPVRLLFALSLFCSWIHASTLLVDALATKSSSSFTACRCPRKRPDSDAARFVRPSFLGRFSSWMWLESLSPISNTSGAAILGMDPHLADLNTRGL